MRQYDQSIFTEPKVIKALKAIEGAARYNQQAMLMQNAQSDAEMNRLKYAQSLAGRLQAGRQALSQLAESSRQALAEQTAAELRALPSSPLARMGRAWGELASKRASGQEMPGQDQLCKERRRQMLANLSIEAKQENLPPNLEELQKQRLQAWSNLASQQQAEKDNLPPNLEELQKQRLQAWHNLASQQKAGNENPLPNYEELQKQRLQAWHNLASQQKAGNENPPPNYEELQKQRLQAWHNLASQQQAQKDNPPPNYEELQKQRLQAWHNLASQQKAGNENALPNHEAIRQQNLQVLRQMAENGQRAISQQANQQIEAQKQKSYEQLQAKKMEAVASLARMNRDTQVKISKNSLNGGEISPEMAARFDQPRYQNGCHKLLNMLPLPTGGVTKRPGFKNIGSSYANSFMLPFIFSANESRVLEFYFSEGVFTGCGFAVWSTEGLVYRDSDAGLPFHKDKLRQISFCQSGDVIFYAHPDLPPGKIMRYSDTDWRHERINFHPPIQPPAILDVFGRGNWPNGEERRISVEYVVTAIDQETGMESEMSAHWTRWGLPPMTQSYWPVVKISKVANAAEYRVYRKKAGVYGFVGTIDKDWDEFEDKNYEPDTADTPPVYKYPFEQEYPSLVFLHQQRLGYAATPSKPMTIWMSNTANYNYFSSSLPPREDDCIEATLAANQANKILWAVSDRQNLALGTEGGEWLLNATEGSGLTPQDLCFQPQTRHGSQAYLNPICCNSGILFIQRGGRNLRELGYSFQDDRYNATDLTLMARHLFEGHRVIRWCWQPEPYGIIWCLLENRQLLALTYLREHEIVAWSQHSYQGQINDIACIPDEKGNWRLFARMWHDGFYNMEMLKEFGGDNSDDDGGVYPARVIPCLPEHGQDGFTAVKKINSFKCRMYHSGRFQARAFGGKAGNGELMEVPSDPGITSTGSRQIADFACNIAAGWRENSGIELIFDGDLPATILGIEFNLEVATGVANQTGR